MLGLIKKLAYVTILFFVGAYVVNFWLANKSYVFKESDIIKIGKKHASNSKGRVEDLVEAIRKDLSSAYPKYILPKDDVQMLFFGLGGFKGGMFLYHASMTEYLLVFGTPLATTGFSVRQWVNRTDVVLRGESKIWKEDTTTVQTNKPGDVVYYGWGTEGVVVYEANLWKLSYGRGFILGSVPHVTATALFHSQDYSTFARTMVLYAKSMFQSFMASF